MGDVGVIDRVCPDCGVKHFTCPECGEVVFGEPADEMCDKCFSGLVPLDAIIRLVAATASRYDGGLVLDALKRDFPQAWPRYASTIINHARGDK